TSPLAFLDFETVSLAIPRWPRCRAWQQVPVQFSAHVEERDGGLVHHQWIADGPEDPRPALAEALVAACTGVRRVVAYHAPFERECIKRLREAAPHLDKELERIERRLVDLLPVIRRDRKSTRLNSSHVSISYAVFCLKKKKRSTPF